MHGHTNDLALVENRDPYVLVTSGSAAVQDPVQVDPDDVRTEGVRGHPLP